MSYLECSLPVDNQALLDSGWSQWIDEHPSNIQDVLRHQLSRLTELERYLSVTIPSEQIRTFLLHRSLLMQGGGRFGVTYEDRWEYSDGLIIDGDHFVFSLNGIKFAVLEAVTGLHKGCPMCLLNNLQGIPFQDFESVREVFEAFKSREGMHVLDAVAGSFVNSCVPLVNSGWEVAMRDPEEFEIEGSDSRAPCFMGVRSKYFERGGKALGLSLSTHLSHVYVCPLNARRRRVQEAMGSVLDMVQ